MQDCLSILVQFVGVIVAAIVPLVVMKRTLTESKDQFEKSRSDDERRHKESIIIQKEEAVIAQRPYLCIDEKSCKTVERDGKPRLQIIIKNIGNGPAYEVEPIIDNVPELNNPVSGMYIKRYSQEMLGYWQLTDYQSNNALPVNSSASLELTPTFWKKGNDDGASNHWDEVQNMFLESEVTLAFRFFDNYNNSYHQRSRIHYSVRKDQEGIWIDKTEWPERDPS